MNPWHTLRYVTFVVREVVAGSLCVARWALTPGASRQTPSIVELPLRSRSDLEITVLTSSITITPGTLVLGVAAADGDVPPTPFVHCVFGGPRDELVAGLRDLENRMLLALRGLHDRGGAR